MALTKGKCDRNEQQAKDRFIPGFAGGQKGVDLARRTVTGIASTIHLDRDGEIILPSAFEARRELFMSSNAPFAAAHTHRTSDGSPTQIGWTMTMAIAAYEVRCGFQFATTDVAEEWWKLASDSRGKGIAFSIGFIPIRWVFGTVADLVAEFPEIKRAVKDAGLKDTDTLRVYTEIELVEISGVMAPSNRQCLQELAAKLFGEKGTESQLDALVSRIATAAKGELASAIAAGVAGIATDIKAYVLEQMDELKAVLPDPLSSLASDDGCRHHLAGGADDSDDPADTAADGKQIEAGLGQVASKLGELVAQLRGGT